MKAILVVLVLALVLAGTVVTALAFGHTSMATEITTAAVQAMAGTSEPAATLLSGSALLGLAGALKRLTV